MYVIKIYNLNSNKNEFYLYNILNVQNIFIPLVQFATSFGQYSVLTYKQK